jgi:epsilon-lactone hydrolase
MPSKQSEAVTRHWEASRIERDLPEDERSDTESWGNLTAEPREVDYIEVHIESDGGSLLAMWAVPKRRAEDQVLLCLHGGGYVSGSIYSHRKMYGHLAKASGAQALLLEYRLAPEYTHPAQVDDTTAAYRWLLGRGHSPEHVAFAGDSTGAALAITGQLRARDLALPLPAATMLFSPGVDLEASGQSYVTNRDRDAFFDAEFVRGLARTFLGERGDTRDPSASPLYADLRGLGPMYIQAAGDEVLLDDARLLAEHSHDAGVDARLDIFPGMQHTFQMAAGRAPEADDAIRRMADWVRPRLLSEQPASAARE